ncbi:MAG: GatB/YqeY domain-containing protein [Lachnospiraceae bacterium]|nr:GatB/YqeY domain-containing protein [Lachnospiraceae bacterium]
MGKIDLVRSEMMAAMKAKDKERKNVLSGLLTELKNFQINKMAELTEEDENHVVLKLIKQSKETLEMTPADRQDIIDECNYTIKVLEEYAPKMMDEEEIKEAINSVLGELSIETPAASDKGKIMKVLMPKVKGKADGSLVNQVLGSMFK